MSPRLAELIQTAIAAAEGNGRDDAAQRLRAILQNAEHLREKLVTGGK